MSRTTLFVNELPFSATAEDIAAHFAEAAGTTAEALVKSVRLIKKGNAFRGTAFVDVHGWEAVDRGVALHQSRFKASADGAQRRINVREAVSKTQLANITEASNKKPVKPTKASRKVYSDDESEEESAADGGGDEDDAAGGKASLGTDRRGRVIVGEIDPQRKRKQLEADLLSKRRSLTDMSVTCRDCAKDFTFTVAEQEFFTERGWPIPRTRCKACSTTKKSKPHKGPAATAAPPQSPDATAKHSGGGGRERGGKPEGGDATVTKPKVGRLPTGKLGGGEKKAKKNGAADMTCFICGAVGHLANGCPQKSLQFKCHACGQVGHKRSECPKAPSAAKLSRKRVARKEDKERGDADAAAAATARPIKKAKV